MALSRRWHRARTQSSEIKGKWNRHIEHSHLPKSAQPDLLTPSLSLLWLLLRRWSWLIEIALLTDYHFNNLTSNVRNPAWGVFFFIVQSVCYLCFSQVGIKMGLGGFSLSLPLGLCPHCPGVAQCYCCSCILAWQGNILITRKWKLKTNPPHLQINQSAKINLNLLDLGKISSCVHACFTSWEIFTLCQMPIFWVWDGKDCCLLLWRFCLLTAPFECSQLLLMPRLTGLQCWQGVFALESYMHLTDHPAPSRF